LFEGGPYTNQDETLLGESVNGVSRAKLRIHERATLRSFKTCLAVEPLDLKKEASHELTVSAAVMTLMTNSSVVNDLSFCGSRPIATLTR